MKLRICALLLSIAPFSVYSMNDRSQRQVNRCDAIKLERTKREHANPELRKQRLAKEKEAEKLLLASFSGKSRCQTNYNTESPILSTEPAPIDTFTWPNSAPITPTWGDYDRAEREDQLQQPPRSTQTTMENSDESQKNVQPLRRRKRRRRNELSNLETWAGTELVGTNKRPRRACTQPQNEFPENAAPWITEFFRNVDLGMLPPVNEDRPNEASNESSDKDGH